MRVHCLWCTSNALHHKIHTKPRWFSRGSFGDKFACRVIHGGDKVFYQVTKLICSDLRWVIRLTASIPRNALESWMYIKSCSVIGCSRDLEAESFTLPFFFSLSFISGSSHLFSCSLPFLHFLRALRIGIEKIFLVSRDNKKLLIHLFLSLSYWIVLPTHSVHRLIPFSTRIWRVFFVFHLLRRDALNQQQNDNYLSHTEDNFHVSFLFRSPWTHLCL